MISKFYKLKKNKWLFSLFLTYLSVFVIDVICIIFNAVQFVVVGFNPAKLGAIFPAFNIIVVCLNILCVCLILIYLVLKRYSKINM